ncbi:MAG: signal peptidase II [Pirellulales bacterium]
MQRSASDALNRSSAVEAGQLSPVAWTRYALFFGLALSGLAADLATKHWIFNRLGMPGVAHERIPIVGDILSLETSLNEGALFGLGQGGVPIFVGLTIFAAGGILYWLFFAGGAHDFWLTLALASVWGGMLGNLWDRLGMHQLHWHYGDRFGEPVFAVRDWIHFQIDGVLDFPVFNIADSLLVCGVTLLMWQTLRADRPAAETAVSQGG